MNGVDILFRQIDNGRKGKNIGLKTGISKMDKYTGGLQKGVYTLIFGTSGSGKSSYVLYTHIYRPLKDYPNKNIKLIYYSLEMSESLLLAKLLCLYIYEEYHYVIPYTDLMSWQEILDDESYEYVKKGKAWLNSIMDKLIIYDKTLNAKFFYKSMMENLEKWGDFEETDDGRRTIYIKNDPDQYVEAIVDHIGLVRPSTGNTKKGEIDEVSSYAVSFREKCQCSFCILMQENRNSADMDRRKADLTECSAEDIKDSGNPYNDAEICIGIYYPLKYKIKNHRGYPIIVENNQQGAFIGLRDRYRSAILIKNRLGESDRLVALNFFGELGYFIELPKADTVTNWKDYCYLKDNQRNKHIQNEDTTIKDEVQNKSESKGLYLKF